MLWSPLLFAMLVEATTHAQRVTRSSDSSQATLRIQATTDHREQDSPSLPLRPRIHYCRSPNMETFTCWWQFPDNSSHGNDNTTYTLTYSVGKGPRKECPDYVTGGANSCYFDSRHTQVWEIYCMNVVAHSRQGDYTSEDHCLDVADIVETDPPFNLTYWLTNSSREESGRSVVVSWMYPNAADVHMGWVTLDFQLQYRRASEPHNWKVKGVLREPRFELLDLPVGSYVVRVRCKSHNSRLWSKWSKLLAISIPAQQSIDKMLGVILVTGISITAFLMIGFGIIPHSKRIKAFLLPPVPKPRIRGIDPTLLKNGKMDEITRLFKSFHGYSPPQYRAESWLHVTTEEDQSLKGSPLAKVSGKVEDFALSAQHNTVVPEELWKHQGSPVYCEVPSQAPGAPPMASSTWAWPSSGPQNTELLPILNLGYAMPPGPAQALGLYACVNGVDTSGAVQLVPCAPPHVRAKPLLQMTETAEKGGAGGRGSEADVLAVSSGGGAGPLGGVAGGCYTTMDELRQQGEQPVDVAAVQADRQEEDLCSEQSQLPAPQRSAVNQDSEP